MNKKKKIIISTIITIVIVLVSFIGVFAYYEYYGQYASILNVDGTIKLDAFDVLYPDLREDLDSNNEKTYGCTPDNPYVIDSVTRLQNLIRLNNNGKLLRAKEKSGADKFYFCLQFDAEEIPQILNLASEGEFSSIGNNEYPFIDELSGVVYAYQISANNYVYYSGCLPEIKTYTLTNPASQASGTYNSNTTYYKLVTGSNYQKVTVADAEEFASLKASLFTATAATESTTYYYAARTYSTSFDTSSKEAAINSISLTSTSAYIPASELIPVHQIIANETIVADNEQVDVGFISSIGNGGYAHDLILYNETIKCEEETPKGLFASFKDVLDALTGHNTNYEDSHDERHIGIFTGHIANGGNAYNISVGGTADVKINTKSVNYFSNYTTVGYIEDSALIGGKLFSEIATDSLLDGDVAGVLFADSIYQLTAGTQDSGSSYALTTIDANSSTGWPGTDGTSFKYGSFTFLLSSSTDVVSSIWNGSKTFLGQSGKNVYSYALYCADEYRYSPDTQSGSAFNQAAASLKETIYDGLTSLDNSGNVIDAGKYIIVAHVGNNYYALKMAAEETNGNIAYYLDTSSSNNVTSFINGTGNLYQSALWEVSTASSKPVFKNSRFDGEYLLGDFENVLFTSDSSHATEFCIDIKNSLLYFDDESGSTNTRYYLNYNVEYNEFYFSDEIDTTIEMYQISDGYDIEEVKSYANIEDNGLYLIVTYYNNNYYLIGTSTNGNTVLQEFSSDVLLSSVSAYSNSFSTTMTTSQYTQYSAYIWRANKTNNQVSFVDKLSQSYYLSNDGNSSVTLSNSQSLWTYSYSNNASHLYANNRYLSSTYVSSSTSTCFNVKNTNSNVYLLSLTPQDATPSYVTYDGALYVDADASTIESGDYAVEARMYGEYYILGLSNATTITYRTKYQLTTTYNKNWTYYSRTGSGTNANPYVYTEETSLTRSNNTTIYYKNGNNYIANNTTTITAGVNYYTRTGNGTNANPYVYTVTNVSLATNEYYTVFTNVDDANVNKYIFNTDTTDLTISTFYLKGLEHQSYVYTNTTTLSASTSSSNKVLWRFDSIDKKLYYLNGENKYYIAFNRTNGFFISSTQSINDGTSYIYLYKYKKQYIYEDVTRITNDAGFYTNSAAYFFFSTLDLSNPNNASRIVGAGESSLTRGSAENVSYFSMQGNYTVSEASSTGTTSASLFNMTTTVDLSYYRWKLAGYLNGTRSGTVYYYSVVYNDGYGKDSSNNYKFLCASSDAGNRILRTYYNNQYNYAYSSQSSYANPPSNVSYHDIIGTGYTHGSSNPACSFNDLEGGNNNKFSFRGSGARYTLVLDDDGMSVAMKKSNSDTTDNGGTTIYYYYCTTITPIDILSLVSSDGDTLEEGIHYAIAAKSGNHYYSMTYDSGVPAAGITGTDMTQQFTSILSAGANGYKQLTTIPSNCDFEQVSNDYKLRFKHYISSTNTTFNYLDFTNSLNNYITSQANTVSYEAITELYYDIVNKRMMYIVGSTTYYISYDETSGVFGTTDNSSDAAEIILVRYTPSYIIKLVPDLTSCDLSSGQYIIAGHDVYNGYTALGEDKSTTNITQYLKAELSEEDYNTILPYIWDQLYYDLYDTYNSDISSNKVNFMFSNAAAPGTSFIAYSASGSNNTYIWNGYSSSSKWVLTVDSNGLWTFFCNVGIGTNRYMYFKGATRNSKLTMTDTYEKNGYYISGTDSVTSVEEGGTQVVLYNYDGNDYTLADGISNGNQYVVFIKNSNYYYLVSNSGNSLVTTPVGKNLNNVGEKISTSNVSNYILTATSATYGFTLKFTGTNYYLYTNGSTLTVNASSVNWKYYYNDTYLNKCRLYTVSGETKTSQALSVSGKKITTSANSKTYLYTVTGSANNYSLGSIASSISTSNKYALVIFENGLYYTVKREGNEIINVSYYASLPTTLSNEEVWSVTGSSNNYHFYQLIDSTQYYIRISGDASLGLDTNYGDSKFLYTYTAGNTSAGTYSANNNSSGDKVYLFKVEKNDKLDATSDVTTLLTGKAQVETSLSVNQTGKYVIAASVDGVDYVLSMIDYEKSMALDVSARFNKALDGDEISLFEASIFEQLGTDYSLVFNSLAFSGSSYYLLDGRYQSQVEGSPTITEYTLYDSNETYYTVNQTVATEYESGKDYYTYDNNVFTLDTTVNSGTDFEGTTKYFLLEATLFDGEDFESGITYYIYNNTSHTYTKVNYKTDTTVLNTVKDDSNYIWAIYTYAVTGGTSYVMGYYDEGLDKTYYLYFDTANKAFKLTDDVTTAKTYQVQIYMLGEEAETQSSYQTFNIELEDDQVTIASFPLTDVKADEFKQYSSTASTSQEAISGKTVSGIIPGEYMIAVKDGNSYYALSLDSSSTCSMSYADVSLYFGGTFEKDMNGYYCISVNTKYIWKQNANNFTYDSATGTVSGLNFLNYAYNVNLCYTGNTTTSISYDGRHVTLVNNSTTYYLKFVNGTGFTWTTIEGEASDIIFYAVGAIAQARQGDPATNYTYYTESLDKLDYTNFAFSEKVIAELQNYANAFGTYEYTTGWLVDSNTTLTEVHDSVFFKSGITFNNDVSTFVSQFSSIEYSYDVENGLVTTTNTITYYAPKGTASFAVANASDVDPVYVNVMVSTQLDTNSLAANIRRYLSLYKVATIDYETNTLETYEEYETSTTSAAAFAKTLLEYRYTPYAAIPLPNSQDTTDTTAAADFVKVGETGYQLDDIGHDHLIAHTFVITEPGVYYLGSTGGSVAFSYLSIDKMKASEESEDSSVSISEDFTIDYVWGEQASSNSSSFSQVNIGLANSSNLDGNVNTIAYVGRKDVNDSLTWTHSNIYPEFIAGTAGLVEPDGGTTYYELSLSEVDSSRITAFDPNVTYYTYSNGAYTEVDQLTTGFDATVAYYVLNNASYTCVNAVPTNGTTYYYVSLTPEGVINLIPQVGGTDITYFMSTRKYYSLTLTTASITEFDDTKAYYTLNNGTYVLEYNPTDYLRLTVSRQYVSTQSSRVNFDYYTVEEIYNFGYGVMYINANKQSLRSYRVVYFDEHILDSESSEFTN